MSAAATPEAPAAVTAHPAVHVVRRSELMYEADGPRRGHAHVGFEDYPRGAPGHLACGRLRLFAQGRMLPGEGIAMHTHSDVDNLLVVLSGCCHHEDSAGGAAALHAGDVSLLAAGRALAHAESVAGDGPLDVLVIMLDPRQRGGASRALTAHLDDDAQHGRLHAFAGGGRFASADVLPLRSESRMLSGKLDAGCRIDHIIQAQAGYVCIAAGGARIDGRPLDAGDRALIDGPGRVGIEAMRDAQLIVVEMDEVAA